MLNYLGSKREGDWGRGPYLQVTEDPWLDPSEQMVYNPSAVLMIG